MGICLLDWSAWRRLSRMSRADALAFLPTVVYNCARMVVEWDPAKARQNVIKHGVSFADAVTALEDDTKQSNEA